MKKNLLLVVLLLVILFQGYRALTYTNPGESTDRYVRKKIQDYQFIFAAGKTWARGLSPHIPEQFKRVYIEELDGQQPVEGWMSYPPTLALVALPIGFLPWKESILVYDTMNFLSFILCLLFCDLIFAHVLKISLHHERLLVGLICGALMASITGVLSTGQTSLFSMAGLLGGFYYWLRASPVKASLCLLFASIKPQLAALPLLFLFFENYRILFWTALFFVGFSLLTFVFTWEKGLLEGYLQSMLLREDTPFNQMSNLSLPHRVAYLMGGKAWRLVPEVIGVLLFLLYYSIIKRQPHTSDSRLYLMGLTLSLSLLFFPLHLYDYCLALFVVVFLCQLQNKLFLLSLPTILLLVRPSIFYFLFEKLGFNINFSDFTIVLSFFLLAPLYLGLIFIELLKQKTLINRQKV